MDTELPHKLCGSSVSMVTQVQSGAGNNTLPRHTQDSYQRQPSTGWKTDFLLTERMNVTRN